MTMPVRLPEVEVMYLDGRTLELRRTPEAVRYYVDGVEVGATAWHQVRYRPVVVAREEVRA